MIPCHIRVGGHVAQPRKRTQREPAIDRTHITERQARDVDDPFERHRAHLPELEQVGAAGKEGGT